jgi:hypothetical protein
MDQRTVDKYFDRIRCLLGFIFLFADGFLTLICWKGEAGQAGSAVIVFKVGVAWRQSIVPPTFLR